VRTFGELPPVELTGFELYCDDVAEGFVKELYWDSQSAHGGASWNWDSIRRASALCLMGFKSCRASPRQRGSGASQQWEAKDPNGKLFR